MNTSKEAKKYIDTLKKQLTERGLVEDVDALILTMIEVSYDKFLTATDFLLKNGTTFTKHTREGDLITEDYPQVKHQLDAQIQLFKYLAEFGCTASSRKRVKDIALPKEESDPFIDFIKNKN